MHKGGSDNAARFFTKKKSCYIKKCLTLASNFESHWPLIWSLNIQHYYQQSYTLKECYDTKGSQRFLSFVLKREKKREKRHYEFRCHRHRVQKKRDTK